MKKISFLLPFLAVIIFIVVPLKTSAADIDTCWIEESDCPQGPIDGLEYLSPKGVKDKSSWDKSIKTGCAYGSRSGHVDRASIRYICYEDEVAAQLEYEYRTYQKIRPGETELGKPYEMSGSCEKKRSTYVGACEGTIVVGRYVASVSAEAHAPKDMHFSTNIAKNAYDDELGAKRLEIVKAVARTFNPKEKVNTDKFSSKTTIEGRAYALDFLGLEQVIPYAKIELEIDGKTFSDISDNEGNYSFELDTDDKKGKIILALAGYRDGKNTFEVIDNSIGTEVVKIWRDIDIEKSVDFVVDVALGKEYESGSKKINIRGLIDKYYHLSQAMDFAKSVLSVDISHIQGKAVLPITLFANSPDADNVEHSSHYDSEFGAIHLTTEDSNYYAPDSPLSVFHEFGHHIMQVLYNPIIWNKELDDGMGFNHGGILNSTTADSLGEGLATFLALRMAQEYKHVYPHVYEPSPIAFGRNWEVNYKAWDAEIYLAREEFAVVSLLNDLVDKHSDAGDDIAMDFTKLWDVVKNEKNQTVKDCYDALIAIEDKAKIDKVFIAHGFFWDKQKGNKSLDNSATYTSSSGETCSVKNMEPALDINKDGEIGEQTEAWMDYSNWHEYPCEPTFDEGDVVGYTGSYQTKERKTFANLPNRFMEVDNGSYKLDFDFPDNSEYNYTVVYEVANNKLPVNFPPARYNTDVIINDDLEISSDEYFSAIKDSFDQEVFRSEKKSSAVPVALWIALGTVIVVITTRQKKKK